MAKLAVDVDKLVRFMEHQNISPAKLAREMGVSRAAVSRVLRRVRGAGTEFIGKLTAAYPETWNNGVIFLDGHSQSVTEPPGPARQSRTA